MRLGMISLFNLMICFTLCASEVLATNGQGVAVNANCIEAGQIVLLSERLSKVEATCAAMRVSVDGRIRAVECRHARADVRGEEIAGKIEKASEDAERFYEKRYVELKEAHDRFEVFVSVSLAVFTLFGVVLPIVVALLQHRTFEREVAQVKNGVEQSLAAKIQGAVDGLQKNGLEAMELTVSHAIRQFDVELRNLDLREGFLQIDYRLIPIVHGLHLVFDSAMRTKRVREVRAAIKKYAPFVARWRDSDDERKRQAWLRVGEGMKNVIINNGAALVESDYENLLGNDSSEYAWLKQFYSVMAPWKFEVPT